MKLHEDEHSVTSISDVGNNIYVGSHKRNVKTMIVNSSNTLSRPQFPRSPLGPLGLQTRSHTQKRKTRTPPWLYGACTVLVGSTPCMRGRGFFSLSFESLYLVHNSSLYVTFLYSLCGKLQVSSIIKKGKESGCWTGKLNLRRFACCFLPHHRSSAHEDSSFFHHLMYSLLSKLSTLSRNNPFRKRSTSFCVGLPRMVCGFVCDITV